MNHKYIIDRIEGGYAIIEKENGDMYKILLDDIRGNYKEGDILIYKDDEYFEIDKEFTLNRKSKIDDAMKNMWEE